MAAASALGRLNDDGDGAPTRATSAADPSVKLAALQSATRLGRFKDAAAVARLAGDGDVVVRRNAAELLGHLRKADGFDALMTMARDPDAAVRNAAAHALGALHDQRARALLDELAKSDPNGLVRDQARVALRRL